LNLKKLLKQIKLNEENISMVLGAMVIVIVGILVVNYFKDKRGETTPVALTTSDINQVEVGKTHTVVKGETLWAIAEEAYGSGYNWTDLYNANKLKNSKVEVGQKLEIPTVTAKKPTVTKPVATVKQAEKVSQTISGDKYTIQKGDSLWSISVSAYGDGYKWTSVAKANKLVNPNVIHPGNVLSLPR
jgi:nucleoid-associated protein YgaU